MFSSHALRAARATNGTKRTNGTSAGSTASIVSTGSTASTGSTGSRAFAGLVQKICARAQAWMLWIMVSAYVLAALVPQFGMALRGVQLGRAGPVSFPLQSLLLGAVIFVAGLTARCERLPALLRHPAPLLVGMAANALLPTALLGVAALAAHGWHNPDEAQCVLVGLALVGAMPVAAGATVFAQGNEGNATLGLGLVVGSTLLSPLTIPLGLHLAGFLTTGGYAIALHRTAGAAGSLFAVLGVVAPCALGLGTNRLLAALRVPLEPALPLIRLANLGIAVLLSYTNACGALGRLVRHPDLDFLLMAVAAAAVMCGSSFLSGWWLARRLGIPRADVIAVTYASGMNNSSAGAVVAATRMAGHPIVLTPILAYSLLQKVLAGTVGALLRRVEPQGCRLALAGDTVTG
jgi:BASS family bile acid:Na+ symporter